MASAERSLRKFHLNYGEILCSFFSLYWLYDVHVATLQV